MAQFNPKEFVYHYRNGKPAYYSYDEELYCGTFPEKWVLDHLPNTGPKECENCACYGSWNGVFLGYCANCAEYVYNGERGRGFIDIGKEVGQNVDLEDAALNGPSVFDTYLKDVLPDDVGDKDFMDSAEIVNNNPSDKNMDISDSDQECQEQNENEINNLSFEERYPDIDINEVNDYYDEMFRRENEMDENENNFGISYTIDGGGFYSNYDGGYDSY